MSSLQLFNYSGQEVRTQLIDGEPWFVLGDLCQVLGLGSPHKVADRISEDDRNQTPVMDSLGRKQSTTIVNESGMYEVIIRSDKPEAKAFRRWLTSEVIPSIRRTGAYGTPVRELTFEEKMAEVMGTLNQRIADQHAALVIAAPKAEAFDALLSTAGDYSVNEAAKVLARDHQIQIGEVRLRNLLEEWKWIYRQSGRPRAMQAQIDTGRMAEKAQFHYHPETGEKVLDTPQVRITAKGVAAIRERILQSKNAAA